MADKLFTKKKKLKNDLKRKKSTRKIYDRILIISEGKKTETNYFKSLIKHLKAPTIDYKFVDIKAAEGSAPISVVKEAIKLLKDSKKEGNPYDRIYCVFDRDSHPSFDEACDLINKVPELNASISYPCFEYWIYCHFDYSRKPHVRTGTKSPCDMAIKELKKIIPEYSKSNVEISESLMSRIETAILNSKKSWTEAMKSNEFNPSTNLFILVNDLISIGTEPPKMLDPPLEKK